MAIAANQTPSMFDEPGESLLAQAERIDVMARSLIDEVGKFRERLLATSTAILPVIGSKLEKKAHPIKACLSYFDTEHQRKFNAPATINGGKDSAIMKRLIETHGEDRVRGFIDEFFAIDDEWVRKCGYTVGVFAARVPGLISQATPAPMKATGVTPKTKDNGRYAHEASDMIKTAYGGAR